MSFAIRNKAIVKARNNGESCAFLARKYGITSSRISAIKKEYDKRKKWKESWQYKTGLPEAYSFYLDEYNSENDFISVIKKNGVANLFNLLTIGASSMRRIIHWLYIKHNELLQDMYPHNPFLEDTVYKMVCEEYYAKQAVL